MNADVDEYVSDKDVKSRFRFVRDSINYLAELLSDDQARNTARNQALSPLVQVLVALRFFASGGFPEVIGDTCTFELPKYRVSRGMTAVSQAVVRRQHNYVNCLAGCGQENCQSKRIPFSECTSHFSDHEGDSNSNSDVLG